MADQDFKIKVVTTADTSGIRQVSAGLTQIQQQQKAAAEQAKSCVPNFNASFASGAGFGYIVARVITGIAQETIKVTEELDKQGEHLVDLSQKWTEMAKAATS